MRISKVFLIALLFCASAESEIYKAVEPTQAESTNTKIADAFSNHLSNIQVSGVGTVTKLLPQDNDGSKHQKFIIRIPSGQTLLVAHNIDVAPAISGLSVGDRVEFYGEYEWNQKGGVIHWTHKDPQGSHVAGWLKHNGQIYQ